MEVKIVEYSQTAAALAELRQRYENVLFPVTTTAGMKDAVAARKELRDIRVGLEKMRKDIKAPALERCRLIDEEAKTITGHLVALEDPIDAQIKAEEQRKEREKQERERAERERVEAIRRKIEGIRSLPVAMSGESADEIAVEIGALEQFTPGEEFAEFVGDAVTAKANALDALRAMHERQAAQEAEAARVAAERAELDRQRQELERIRAEIEAAKAPAAVQHEDKIGLTYDDPKPDLSKVLQQQLSAVVDSLEDAKQEAISDAVVHGMGMTAMKFDADAGTITETHIPHQAIVKAKPTRPSDDEIIDALSLHFRVHESKVIEWLLDMDLHAASARMVEAV